KSYPQFVRAAARYAISAGIESDFLKSLTNEYLDAHLDRGPYGTALELAGGTPRAILRRALRAACPASISWNRLNELEALCGKERGRIGLDADHCAERVGSCIYFVPKRAAGTEPVNLSLSGTTRLPGICEIVATSAPAVPI